MRFLPIFFLRCRWVGLPLCLSLVSLAGVELAQAIEAPRVNVLAQSSSGTLAPATIAAIAPEVGLRFQNSSELNQLTLVTRRGTSLHSSPQGQGYCAGQLYVPAPVQTYYSDYVTAGTGKAWFVSAKTPPAEGLRVVIRNTTAGLDLDNVPYTDREYNQGLASESFAVQEGSSHQLRQFVMRSGKNELSYQIKRGSQVIESGQFTVMVKSETQDDTRTAISAPSTYQPSSYYSDYCRDKSYHYRDGYKYGDRHDHKRYDRDHKRHDRHDRHDHHDRHDRHDAPKPYVPDVPKPYVPDVPQPYVPPKSDTPPPPTTNRRGDQHQHNPNFDRGPGEIPAPQRIEW